MSQIDEFKKGLIKVVVYALLSLFLLPACALWFVDHAESVRDTEIVERVNQNVDKDASLLAADRQFLKGFFQNNPPSSLCSNSSSDPNVVGFRARVCAPYSELWQYRLVETIATWTLIGGAIVLLAILVTGGIAFLNRKAQYLSFVVGWNLLRIASAAEVVLQGALLLWLSFWVTAFFFEKYFLKIILIAGLLAGGAVFHAIVGIFRRPPRSTGINGEVVSKEDAPVLWAHIEDRAKRLQTAPPDQIIAGIDTNFFVTESPLTVRQKILKGRSLFVSLPLLRILDRKEADAVLAHELAHFSGGDTASSAALGPKLVQYDHYCMLMRHGGATIVVFHMIYLYRLIFEFALRRDSREREFRADRIAAQLESPHAIIGSLIKVAAYANYRSQVEQQLFEQSGRHDDKLGIAAQISAGLAPYAASASFTDSMQTANIPHPFDSHPPMIERMRNVNLRVAEKDYSWIVTRVPNSSWVADIKSADDIEQKLWSEYEQQFAAQHEVSLAYRYEPANEAERAIVLKYFPPVSFDLKRDKQFTITFSGVDVPNEGEISWDRISDLKYTDGIGGDVLEIIHPEKGLLGAKKTKVKLPGIGKQRDQFKETLAKYWQRHRAMREQISAH